LEKKIPSVFERFFVSMNIPPKKKRDIMATTLKVGGIEHLFFILRASLPLLS
jgi:hypothetical protein